jgi:hypothetical protein
LRFGFCPDVGVKFSEFHRVRALRMIGVRN